MNGRKRRFETTEEPVGVMERAKTQAAEVGRQANELVDRHPASTTFVAFGAGIAAGLAVAAILMPRRPASAWYEGYLPNWLPASQIRQLLPNSFACHR